MPLNKVKDLLKGVADKGAGLTNDLTEWYGALNPDVQKAITRGLAGAAIGGTAGHFLGAGRDRDRTRVSPALMGMLAGAGAGVAIPAGLKMLGGGDLFADAPPATPSGLPSRAVNSGAWHLAKNPWKYTAPAMMAWKGGGLGPWKLLWHGAKNTAREGGGLYAREKAQPFAVASTTKHLIKHLFTGGKGSVGDPSRRDALRALGIKHLMPGGGAAITAEKARDASLHRRLAMALRSKDLWKNPRGAVNLKTLAEQAANSKKMKVIPRGKRGLLLLPAALGAGYIADKYWKGDW